MEAQSLEQRMDRVEQEMFGPQGLKAEMKALALQISHLHGAMNVGFAALDSNLRAEIRAGDEETRRLLRDEIRAGDEETRQLLRASEEETRQRVLELQQVTMHAFDRTIAVSQDETRRRIQSMHEDLIERFAALARADRPGTDASPDRAEE